MNIIDKIHMVHRFWRFRLRSEGESVSFILGQDLSRKTVIDIGANKGIYTYWLSKKVGVHGKVIAFEAQPELKTHLQDVIKSFRLTNVELQNVGLSDKSGKATMLRRFAGDGGAALEEVFEESNPLIKEWKRYPSI